jgi:transposase-like protein
MTAQYTEGFKRQMVQKMLGPPARSAKSVAREVGGPHYTTLSQWRRDAVTMTGMDEKHRNGKSTRSWTAAEKMDVLNRSASLSEDKLGAFLREQGIYEAQLAQWRAEAIGGLSGETGSNELSTQLNAERKKVKDLERELRRKEKALAEAAALLVLQKKVQAIWGDGEGGTRGKND